MKNGLSLTGKKWHILNQNSGDSIINVILKNRNLPLNHMEYFRLSDRMHDPSLLKDMEKGVSRIKQAIEKKERIVVFGDYDVDGISATALIIYLFRRLNFPVKHVIPHREKDGYGLRSGGIDRVNALGADLIITVDNGISAHEAIDYANSLGIDVLVTDHHLQNEQLPNACAVINPNRLDSDYPFKDICGVTVAFKLAYALLRDLLPEDDFKQFLLSHLDLVALGTIADVMPIRDENYAFVKFGLKVLSNTKKPGLIHLKKVSGLKMNDLTPVAVGYFLAPRLNAAGRIEHANLALKLLIEESESEAQKIAEELNNLNKERQELQQEYLDHALEQLDDIDTLNKVIIIYNDEWQPGIIGLVSGRLKEKYYRPALVFTRDKEGNYVGSARSIEAFHITEALTRFKRYFLTYGGHQKAAGLTIPAEKFSLFKEEFVEYANDLIQDKQLIPELIIDSVIDVDQINWNVANDIQNIGPYGETNPEPSLLLKDARIDSLRLIGSDRHLKFNVEKMNKRYECVWWGGADFKDHIQIGDLCDFVFKMNLNLFRGAQKVQLTVEDMHLKKSVHE